MAPVPYVETTVECRLHISGGDEPARTIFLASAPSLIRIHDEVSGLICVYRLIHEYTLRGLAEYLFDHIA